ncbi:uncharacterized protein BX663DRAFT_415147, partial [Cokeromyces recurvatus]|uniref:uncharacterized protein n=1 Tax=Cokeromyces recurvatus TaxID=90255 RepID=UPI00221F1986
MIPELDSISSPFAREEWIVKQMNKIISATTFTDTDDLLYDDSIRTASRTFRQTFDVPFTERLVNC